MEKEKNTNAKKQQITTKQYAKSSSRNNNENLMNTNTLMKTTNKLRVSVEKIKNTETKDSHNIRHNLNTKFQINSRNTSSKVRVIVSNTKKDIKSHLNNRVYVDF